MSEPLGKVAVSHLCKSFGPVRAVEDVSFTAEPGTVTGFLGPNGAGKTTTLRLILGLLSATSGTATIDGVPYRALDRPAATVGATFDPRSFHPGRTAVGHLSVLAPQAGVGRERIDEVLALVGLTAFAHRRLGGYSLGMCQRLALAAALLAEPRVLLFDEPANGLDPEGIVWLRTFLRTLASSGHTVIVSSHLLSEVRQWADDILIMSKGRLVHQSTMAELTAMARPVTDVAAAPSAAGRMAELIAERSWQATAHEDGFRIADVPPAEVGHACFTRGIEVHRLANVGGDLETLFLSLTEDQPQGGTLLAAPPTGTPPAVAPSPVGAPQTPAESAAPSQGPSAHARHAQQGDGR